jgi:hypothetical protein
MMGTTHDVGAALGALRTLEWYGRVIIIPCGWQVRFEHECRHASCIG